MDRSIHDNTIYAYLVIGEQERNRYTIHLYTEFTDTTPTEYTDVIFSGVRAHHFQNVCSGTILFSIELITMEECYAEYEPVFIALAKEAWPISYTSPENLFQQAKHLSETLYHLTSSYGLTGWIWAEHMVLSLREKRFPA